MYNFKNAKRENLKVFSLFLINYNLKHKRRRKPMVFSSIFIELIQFPLTGIKLIVASLHFEKLLVSTALDDLALLKHHDSV